MLVMKRFILENRLLNNLMNFSIQILLLTNLWVILYRTIINFLNHRFSPVIKETFYRPAAVSPEPFEMPLYVLLTFIFIVLIISFQGLLKRFESRRSSATVFFTKLTILVLLLLFFLKLLGNFPLANDFYPYQLRMDKTIYNAFLFFYTLFFAFIIVETTTLERFLGKKKWFKPILYLALTVIIAIVIFEPGFPIFSYEYSYFFGPIWDVIQGKTIFTNANSDYGFFSILFFAALHKLKLFQFSQLPVYIWFMFLVQYFLIFYLVYKVSKSLLLSLVAIFAIIAINYLSYPLHPITVTQYSAMRRLPAVLLLYILFRFKRLDSPAFLVFPAFFGFWIIDTGISMYLALGLTIFILFLSKSMSFNSSVRTLAILFLNLIGVFFVLNLIHLLIGYQPINFVQLFISINQYATTGLTMIPLPARDFFWIFILIYIASVTFFIRKEKHDTNHYLLLLCANLAFFNAFYYVGRSHPANLLDISVLIVFNIFLLVALVWKDIVSYKVKAAIALILFLLFIFFPLSQRRYTLTELTLERLKKLQAGPLIASNIENQIGEFFKKERVLIDKNLRSKDVVILSRDDTYLLMVTGRRNLLRVNPQAAIDTAREMEFALKDTVGLCPNKIAVDCTLYHRCSDFTSYTNKDFFLAPYILESLEKKCSVRYQPTACTNKLCIAESTKL